MLSKYRVKGGLPVLLWQDLNETFRREVSAKSSRSNQPRSILIEAKERLLRFRRCAFDRVRVIVSFAGCRRTKTPCLTLISRVARAKRQRGTWARQKLFRLCNRQPVYIFARVRSQGTSLRRNVATFCRIYRTRRHVGTKNVTRTGECSVNIDKFYVVQHAACSRTNGGAASCFRRRVLEMRVQPPSEPREKEEEREREREFSRERTDHFVRNSKISRWFFAATFWQSSTLSSRDEERAASGDVGEERRRQRRNISNRETELHLHRLHVQDLEMWEISFRRKNLISRKNRAVTVRRRDSFEEFMSRKLVSEIICQSSSRCMAARLSSAQPFEKRHCQVGREETFNAGTNVHT